MADFDALLWDVDGTLLDFLAAEAVSMQSLFKDFGLGDCTQEMIERYSAINAAYWKIGAAEELHGLVVFQDPQLCRVDPRDLHLSLHAQRPL